MVFLGLERAPAPAVPLFDDLDEAEPEEEGAGAGIVRRFCAANKLALFKGL